MSPCPWRTGNGGRLHVPWEVGEAVTGEIAVTEGAVCVAKLVSFPGSERRTRARARLMSAADEMYNALASIENDDGSIPDHIWELRNAALSKARGEAG